MSLVTGATSRSPAWIAAQLASRQQSVCRFNCAAAVLRADVAHVRQSAVSASQTVRNTRGRLVNPARKRRTRRSDGPLPLVRGAAMVKANSVAWQVNRETFTGRCLSHRTASPSEVEHLAASLAEYSAALKVVKDGRQRRTMVEVVCPECGSPRLYRPRDFADSVDRQSLRLCRRHA